MVKELETWVDVPDLRGPSPRNETLENAASCPVGFFGWDWRYTRTNLRSRRVVKGRDGYMHMQLHRAYMGTFYGRPDGEGRSEFVTIRFWARHPVLACREIAARIRNGENPEWIKGTTIN